MLKEMAEAVAKTTSLYEDAVSQLKDVALSGYTKAGRDRLGQLIDEVNLAEHEADLVESKAAAYVFSHGEEAPLAAVHMYRVLQRMDDVANACEKAANGLLSIVYNESVHPYFSAKAEGPNSSISSSVGLVAIQANWATAIPVTRSNR